MMRNAYSQVLWIYLRRPWTSLLLGTFLVSGLFSLMTIAVMRPHLEVALPQLTISFIFLNLNLWLIFYEQIVSPRLRLWPNFVGPQLLGFVAASTPLLLIIVLAMDRCKNASVLGATALEVAFFTLMGLGILLQSLWFLLALLSGFSWLMFGAGFSCINHIFVGEVPDISLQLLLVSLLVLAVVLWRFFNLHEDNPGYRMPSGLDFAGIKPQVTGDGNRAWAQVHETGILAYLRDANMRPVTASASRWDRIQRRRYQGSWMLVVMGVFIMVITMVLPMFVMRGATGAFPNFFPDQMLLSLLASVCFTWLGRWKYIEVELLTPANRGDLFKELGLAMMVDFALVLALSLVAMLVPALIWYPQVDRTFLILNGLLHVAAAILSFGFTAWALRIRSVGVHMLNLLIVLPFSVLTILPSGPLHNATYLPWVLSGLGLSTLVGIALAYRGYHLWLNTELG